MRALLIAAGLVLAIAACEDRFRYPCQDNKNWNKPQCQRPTCAMTGTCPDQLVKPEEMKEDTAK
jgi:cobalamin biosynthesis protein CobD/CbiB